MCTPRYCRIPTYRPRSYRRGLADMLRSARDNRTSKARRRLRASSARCERLARRAATLLFVASHRRLNPANEKAHWALPAAVQAAAPHGTTELLKPRRCRARCRPSEHALRSAPCFEGLASAEALKRCNAPSPQGSCKSPRPIKQPNFCGHHGHRPG